MRVSKIGSRWLRVVSADGKIRYFSSSDISSLRLFWIFRNFSSLDDRVLSARQLHFIKSVCRAGESQTKAVDPADVLGTLELARTADNHDWSAPAAPLFESAKAEAAPYRHQPLPSRQPFAVSAVVLTVLILTLGAALTNHGVRLRISSVVSELRTFAQSLLPRVPQQSTDARHVSTGKETSTRKALQPTVLRVAANVDSGTSTYPQLITARDSINDAVSIGGADSGSIASLQTGDLRLASLVPASLPFSKLSSNSLLGSAKPSPVISTSQSNAANVVAAEHTSGLIRNSRSSASLRKELSARVKPSTQILRPSGPPLVHPVPDLSPVSRDMQVVLRAVVSPDGRVAQVDVVEGNSKLAREAARAVTSWRYSPRAVSENAESRIMFRVSPDVVIVSFPESGREIARR